MSEPNFERRTALQSIELRAGEGTDAVILVGYAAVFNQESAELNDGYGPFRELLAPGCFTRTLRDGNRSRG